MRADFGVSWVGGLHFSEGSIHGEVRDRGTVSRLAPHLLTQGAEVVLTGLRNRWTWSRGVSPEAAGVGKVQDK